MRLRTALVLAGPDRTGRTAAHGETTVADVLAEMGDADGPEVAAFVGSDDRTVEVYLAGGDGRAVGDWPIAVILPPDGSMAGERSRRG